MGKLTEWHANFPKQPQPRTKYTMSEIQEILDAVHDLVVDIEDRCPSSAEQVKLYESLPEEIKMLFEEWGGHDTVARDMAHEFLHSKF